MDDRKFCVWCGGRVEKRATRNLCPNHLRLAAGFDSAVEQRIATDDWQPPGNVPLYHEPDPG